MDRLHIALLAIAGVGLAGGLAAMGLGQADLATWIFRAGVVPVLAALVWEIVASLSKGEVGLDIVAALSMTAALLFGETLAAAVVALMYAGGNFLESFAEGRARRDMEELLRRVPRHAARYGAGGLQTVPIDDVRPGDVLLVRQGEMVAVDGLVQGRAVLDLSALTGESLPVTLTAGEEALSGGTNAGAAFDLRATRLAAESTYAGIVRLVEAAQQSKAPMARLADRWSLGFLAVTLVLTGLAYALSGDPIRAVAVLVVATPCPLILAVPVALVAGLSRAARFGVLVKGAGPLETLARVVTLVLDKTGTLTDGRPQLVEIVAVDGVDEDEILRLAASLDQASKHPVAQAIVAAAKARELALSLPEAASEEAGEGVSGRIDGRAVTVGGWRFVAGNTPHPDTAAGAVLVAVGINGQLAGHLLMADPLRAGAAATLRALRESGVKRLVLATGDRADVAAHITDGLGFDAIHAGLAPDQKVAAVAAERQYGPVLMVGDGVNDAPALAAADVGVAMGARGAAAAAEAADVVLLVDQVDRLRTALHVARGARRIALESVVAGIGFSVLGMIAAALGWLPPVQGALLQEAIDVAVILNALRALAITPPPALTDIAGAQTSPRKMPA